MDNGPERYSRLRKRLFPTNVMKRNLKNVSSLGTWDAFGAFGPKGSSSYVQTQVWSERDLSASSHVFLAFFPCQVINPRPDAVDPSSSSSIVHGNPQIVRLDQFYIDVINSIDRHKVRACAESCSPGVLVCKVRVPKRRFEPVTPVASSGISQSTNGGLVVLVALATHTRESFPETKRLRCFHALHE